ncbi:hypothetical protein VC187_16145, partial [Xanthomonas campestris]|nr:hypothetical protein [Xanthomonas campestris]MEA9510014.1 hypothetical protein [Xanthomonas campestris]
QTQHQPAVHPFGLLGTITQKIVNRFLEESDSAEASDWFSGAKSGIYLTEEVIGLGSFGRTLTLLTLEDGGEDDDI